MTKILGNSLPVLGLAAVIAAASAGPLKAQSNHPWWVPFLGCWAPVDSEDADTVLCFRADGEGIELSTVVDGRSTSTDSVVADGVERTETIDGCTGSRSAAFSADGRRVFTRSRVACANQTRSSSGVMAFIAPDAWVDARSIEIEGEAAAWLQEYRPVAPEWFDEHGIDDPAAADRSSVSAMRQWASEPIGIDDVQEAVSRIATAAVEIWVAVQPTAFRLDGDAIVRLAESGMPASVIDIMVAVSYPDRFALTVRGTVTEREPEPPAAVRYSVRHRPVFRSPYFDPYFVWGSYGYDWYGYPVYYPYPVYGPVWYPPRRIYSRPVVVVEPRPPASRGRMVNDRGYIPRTTNSRTARPAGADATISDRGYSAPSPTSVRNPALDVQAAPAARSSRRSAQPAGGGATISNRGYSAPPAARAPAPAARSAPASRPTPQVRSAPAPRPAPEARSARPAARASAPAARSAPAPRSAPQARSAPQTSAPQPAPSSSATPTGRTARPRN